MQEAMTAFPGRRPSDGDGPTKDTSGSSSTVAACWNASPGGTTGSRGPGSAGSSSIATTTTSTRNDGARRYEYDDEGSSFECDVPVLSPLPRPLVFAQSKTVLEQQQQQQEGNSIGDANATDERGQTGQTEGEEEAKNVPPSPSPSPTTVALLSATAARAQPFAFVPIIAPSPGADMSTTYFAAEPLIETSENPKDPENVGWARSPTEVRRSRCSPCRALRALLVVLGHVVLVWAVLVAVKGGRWRGSGRGDGRLEPGPHGEPQSGLVPGHDHIFQCVPKFVQSSIAEFQEPGAFEVREALRLHQGHHLHHVSGHIHLLPGGVDQKPQVVVNTTVWSSWAQTLDRRIATETTETGLQLQFVSAGPPDGDDEQDDDDGDVCTFIRVDIAVAPSTTLSALSVRSSHLSLAFHAGLAPEHLVVTNTTDVRLAAGSVTAADASAVPPARNTTVELASGAIEGVYPLVDLLRLRTASGAIAVDVLPYPSSPLRAASLGPSSPPPVSAIPPAIFDASTHAGVVNITFPATADAVPPRTYVTTVRTASGDLRGRFLLGAQTTLKSEVGAMTAAVLPVCAPDDEEEEEEEEAERQAGNYTHALTTRNAAGATLLTLLPPLRLLPPANSSSPSPPLSIRATHTSHTGFLRAVYPLAWQGAVCAASRVGRAAVGGEGVVVARRERWGWVGERVWGVKGDGDVEEVDVTMSVQAGDVEFSVEDVDVGSVDGGEEGEL